MLKKFVYWLVFISAVLGAVGIIMQLIRFGTIVESSPWGAGL